MGINIKKLAAKYKKAFKKYDFTTTGFYRELKKKKLKPETIMALLKEVYKVDDKEADEVMRYVEFEETNCMYCGKIFKMADGNISLCEICQEKNDKLWEKMLKDNPNFYELDEDDQTKIAVWVHMVGALC